MQWSCLVLAVKCSTAITKHPSWIKSHTNLFSSHKASLHHVVPTQVPNISCFPPKYPPLYTMLSPKGGLWVQIFKIPHHQGGNPGRTGTYVQISHWMGSVTTAQTMKFSITNFFSKCNQIPKKLQIWSHLLKKSVMENFIFCAVHLARTLCVVY